MKKIIFIIISILSIQILSAEISEQKLQSYKNMFLNKILKNRHHKSYKIKRYINGIIPQGNAGIKLIDKFAFFLYDMEKNGLKLSKVRFFYKKRVIMFFLLLKEKTSDQIYNIYLEYDYTWSGKCLLRDVYFSAVFLKKQKILIEFFKNR